MLKSIGNTLLAFGNTLLAFGPLGLFLFALLDSLGVPLVAGVDIFLIAMAVQNPDLAYLGATAATLGSLAGNLMLFSGARYGVRRFASSEVADSRRQKFRLWFQRYGLLTVFIPAVTPFVPLPLKVFVISAGAMHTRLSRFTAVVFGARVIRYFGEAYLGIKLGENAHGYLTRNAWGIAGAALALMLVLVGIIKWYGRRHAEA